MNTASIQGSTSVKERDDKSLYSWCTHIRSARNKPGECKLKLTADRIATLDAIGFDWRSETKTRSWISFIDRVEALREYKEKHGHLSVTFKANESLYCWCANIRSVRRGKVGKCKIKLTQERIAALDAIGFDWRWSKSVSQPFDSLVDDADKASGKSEENNNTVQNWEDEQHDDIERVGISDALLTSQEINHDGLTEEEKLCSMRLNAV